LLAEAGEREYAVSLISPALLKNANAVKRMETMVFEISPNNRASYRHKVSYTILNESGERWAMFGEIYDKLRTIESFEGSLYDAAGVKIRTLKRSDIRDESANNGSALADDDRVKWHNFFHKIFPYTVEYEIEIRYKGTMFLPRWIPVERSQLSVERSVLTIISPIGNLVRFKMFNYPAEPAITDNGSVRTYNWEVKALPAIVNEPYSPAWHEITTSVYLATDHFSLEDYNGSNASWKDFGKFAYDLKNGKDKLPDAVKQKVHELVDGIPDVKEKINRLYKYLQQNTHYISIQLGIGGWQPLDADYVGSKGYGDCKALSNFMFALLKEAGIRSVYTLTYRGPNSNYLLTDFPACQFNHVILFVPGEKDTTWLECTSQTMEPGYLGSDNSDRWALATDENGGKLVRTPSYGVNENVQTRRIKAKLNSEGHLDVDAETVYQAGQQDELHWMINHLPKEKVKEYLQEKLGFATYDIRDFSYREIKNILPAIKEKLFITVSDYATVTDKRLFIVPNMMSKDVKPMSRDFLRINDLVQSIAYTDIDTVEIRLPDGYLPESIPGAVSLISQFGKYNSSVSVSGDTIFYIRRFEKYNGRFPASDYQRLAEFTNAVYKADNYKLVLRKDHDYKKGF
jgi:transglutaminase-like putative cysteine protease